MKSFHEITAKNILGVTADTFREVFYEKTAALVHNSDRGR